MYDKSYTEEKSKRALNIQGLFRHSRFFNLRKPIFGNIRSYLSDSYTIIMAISLGWKTCGLADYSSASAWVKFIDQEQQVCLSQQEYERLVAIREQIKLTSAQSISSHLEDRQEKSKADIEQATDLILLTLNHAWVTQRVPRDFIYQ